MAFTREQYDALIEAISTGAKFVKYSDKEIEYMPLDKMLQLKRSMERDLGIGRLRRTTIGVYDKGLTDNRRVRTYQQPVINITAPTQEFRDITVFIKETPNPAVLLSVGNGLDIYAEYAPGDYLILRTAEDNEDDEVAWMAGKKVRIPITISGNAKQIIDIDSELGKITYPLLDGDIVTLSVKDYV